MFTGLVEELGVVREVAAAPAGCALTVACEEVCDGLAVGDSVSVSGCCLTVTALADDGAFVAEVMGETLARTTLGGLAAGEAVNLERPLRADGRLGGHIVQGHVDGVGEVRAVEPRGDGPDGWTLLAVQLPAALGPYVVEKGSIAVDGVSLTLAGVGDEHGAAIVEIGVIPHTSAITTLGRRRPGDRVNVEVDLIAKYVERLLGAQAGDGGQS